MYEIRVESVPTIDRAGLPVFAEFDELMERVRIRAYELAELRGFTDDRALDDWLAAECEVCGPPAQIAEDDADYVLGVQLPGFAPGEIVVTATPHEVLIKAARLMTPPAARSSKKSDVPIQEPGSIETWRRVVLPHEVHVEGVSATLEGGMLRIVAPKLTAVMAAAARNAAEAPVTEPVVTPIRIEVEAAAA